MFEVITHNGLSRSQGGKVVGYHVPGSSVMHTVLGYAVVWPPRQPQKPVPSSTPPAAKRSQDLRFADLPQCKTPTNRCTHCDSWQTLYLKKNLADGRHIILLCRECDTVMRPYGD